MRRIFSVLFGVLATANIFAPNAIAAPDPSPVVMVAPAPAPNPAPAPAAFTGGDASYEAMCALAQIVVATPPDDVEPTDPGWPGFCGGIGQQFTNHGEQNYHYKSYVIYICDAEIPSQMHTYYMTMENTSCNNTTMQLFFQDYDQVMSLCPAMPTCVLDPNGGPGAGLYYKIEIKAPGCAFDHMMGWIRKEPYNVTRDTPIAPIRLGIDCPNDTTLPFGKPYAPPAEFCEADMQIKCHVDDLWCL